MNILSKPVTKICTLYTLPLLYLIIYGQFSILLKEHTNIISSIFIILLIITSIAIAFIAYNSLCISTSSYEKTLTMFLTLTILTSPFGDFIIIPILGTIITSFFDPIFRKNFFTTFDRLDYAWSIFCCYCLFNSFFAQSNISVSIGMSLAYFGYGILFKLAKTFIFPKNIVPSLEILFSWTLISTISLALFQLFFNKNIYIFNFKLYKNGNPGLASIFSNWPANTAGFLVMSFVILLYIFYKNFQSSDYKRITMASIILTFIAILATETRMALLFLIGFLGAFLIFYPFQLFRKSRFILLVIPILMILILPFYSEKWKNTLSKPLQQNTIADRIHQYQFSFKILSEHNPIFGIGLMNFRYLYEKYGNPLIQKIDPSHPRIEFIHNIYLSILTETGIIGLILFLYAVGVLILKLWSHLPNPAAYFGLYFIAGLFSVNTVDCWLSILKFSLFMFITLGITTAKASQNKYS